MNCPRCGKEMVTVDDAGYPPTFGYLACDCGGITIASNVNPGWTALLARAEKAEAACAEWREAWALATKSAVGIDRKPLDAVAHSPSPGSDLLERLRKAECANSIGNVLDGVRCKDIAALRAENERLRKTVEAFQSEQSAHHVAASKEIERLREACSAWSGGMTVISTNIKIDVHGRKVARIDLVEDVACRFVGVDLGRSESVSVAHPPLFCGSHGHRLPCGECGIAKMQSAPVQPWPWPDAAFAGLPPLDKPGGFTPRHRRSLWPLALAAVAVWFSLAVAAVSVVMTAVECGWFAAAWAWVVEVMG